MKHAHVLNLYTYHMQISLNVQDMELVGMFGLAASWKCLVSKYPV